MKERKRKKKVKIEWKRNKEQRIQNEEANWWNKVK